MPAGGLRYPVHAGLSGDPRRIGCDVRAQRYRELLYAKIKRSTSDPRTDADTVYGPLLRRMPTAGLRATEHDSVSTPVTAHRHLRGGLRRRRDARLIITPGHALRLREAAECDSSPVSITSSRARIDVVTSNHRAVVDRCRPRQ